MRTRAELLADTMSELRLTPDHRYFCGAQELPGVTRILSAVIPRRYSPDPWYLSRGSALHKAIHLLANNQLDRTTVDESYLGKLAAFEKFRREVGGRIVASEKKLCSRRYLFAGAIDAVLALPDRTLLLDWKSSFEPCVELQLGAYWLLLHESSAVTGLSADEAGAVVLKDDGSYKLHVFEKRRLQLGGQKFLACLAVYNFMKENNLLPKEQ